MRCFNENLLPTDCDKNKKMTSLATSKFQFSLKLMINKDWSSLITKKRSTNCCKFKKSSKAGNTLAQRTELRQPMCGALHKSGHAHLSQRGAWPDPLAVGPSKRYSTSHIWISGWFTSARETINPYHAAVASVQVCSRLNQKPTHAGFSQGSVLRPILYLPNMADTPINEDAVIALFADDTVTVTYCDNYESVVVSSGQFIIYPAGQKTEKSDWMSLSKYELTFCKDLVLTCPPA